LLKKMKNLAIPLQNNCKNIVKYIVFVCWASCKQGDQMSLSKKSPKI
jgi:hypothetical protein